MGEIVRRGARGEVKMGFKNIRTGQSMQNDISQMQRDMLKLANDELPDKLIVELEALVDDSFEKEQFQDNRSSKWQGRKYDKEGKNARTQRRGLLIGSGAMHNEISVEKRGNTVVIGSDKVYAPVHNEGLRAGKGAGFDMPQRQFMPIPGEPLPAPTQQKIDLFLDDKVTKILG